MSKVQGNMMKVPSILYLFLDAKHNIAPIIPERLGCRGVCHKIICHRLYISPIF